MKGRILIVYFLIINIFVTNSKKSRHWFNQTNSIRFAFETTCCQRISSGYSMSNKH